MNIDLNSRSIVRCSRCGVRSRVNRAVNWNLDMRRGIVAAVICWACQTPAENAEAEINEATLDYIGPDAFGRLIARPKAVFA